MSGFKERVILQNQEMFGIIPNFESALLGAISISLNKMCVCGERERENENEEGFDAQKLKREGINN